MARRNYERGTGMFYVTKRHLSFPGLLNEKGEQKRWVAGDAVPEAFDWKIAPSLVATGQLEWRPFAVTDPGLDADGSSIAVAPSPAILEASKSGADSKAAKPKNAPK